MKSCSTEDIGGVQAGELCDGQCQVVRSGQGNDQAALQAIGDTRGRRHVEGKASTCAVMSRQGKEVAMVEAGNVCRGGRGTGGWRRRLWWRLRRGSVKCCGRRKRAQVDGLVGRGEVLGTVAPMAWGGEAI
jgi:hypothetical protein